MNPTVFRGDDASEKNARKVTDVGHTTGDRPTTGNTAEFMTRVSFNGPVEGEVSIAKGMWNQPGGAIQVKLPWSPNVQFSPGYSLPSGFMPIIPPSWWKPIKIWN